jgi:hypothetical protein
MIDVDRLEDVFVAIVSRPGLARAHWDEIAPALHICAVVKTPELFGSDDELWARTSRFGAVQRIRTKTRCPTPSSFGAAHRIRIKTSCAAGWRVRWRKA